MATTTYLQISNPENNTNTFTIKEVPNPSDSNFASTTLPTQPISIFASASKSTLGEEWINFDWNAGPLLLQGIVSTTTKGVGLELSFREGDEGVRLVGVFWGDLEKGLQSRYEGGSTNARVDVSLREGKYVWVDAERDSWAKKRVVLTLSG